MKPYTKTLDHDRVIAVLEKYKSEHGEYPPTGAMSKLAQQYPDLLPSVRKIQNDGGIVNFYRSLGLKYEDARTGLRRATVALDAIRKSMVYDSSFGSFLVSKFGERNVHWQSPYNTDGKTLHRSDFKVFRDNGSFFFVDLFYPQDMESLQGCVNIKIKKLMKTKIEKNAIVYFVACNNETISPTLITRYLKTRKNAWLPNVNLVHISEAPLVCI